MLRPPVRRAGVPYDGHLHAGVPRDRVKEKVKEYMRLFAGRPRKPAEASKKDSAADLGAPE